MGLPQPDSTLSSTSHGLHPGDSKPGCQDLFQGLGASGRSKGVRFSAVFGASASTGDAVKPKPPLPSSKYHGIVTSSMVPENISTKSSKPAVRQGSLFGGGQSHMTSFGRGHSNSHNMATPGNVNSTVKQPSAIAKPSSLSSNSPPSLPKLPSMSIAEAVKLTRSRPNAQMKIVAGGEGRGPNLDVIDAVHDETDDSPYANFSRSANLAKEKLSGKEVTGLYVRNVPLDMRQESLANIFRQFGPVLNVFIKTPSNCAYTSTWAIVKVPSMRDAMKVLEKLNEAPPFYFRVEIGLTEDERRARRALRSSLEHTENEVTAEVAAHDAGIRKYLASFPTPAPSVDPAAGVGRGKKLVETVSVQRQSSLSGSQAQNYGTQKSVTATENRESGSLNIYGLAAGKEAMSVKNESPFVRDQLPGLSMTAAAIDSMETPPSCADRRNVSLETVVRRLNFCSKEHQSDNISETDDEEGEKVEGTGEENKENEKNEGKKDNEKRIERVENEERENENEKGRTEGEEREEDEDGLGPPFLVAVGSVADGAAGLNAELSVDMKNRGTVPSADGGTALACSSEPHATATSATKHALQTEFLSGEAPGSAGKLGEAPGSAGKLGEAPGSAGKLGEAPGSAGKLGEAPGSAGKLGEAPGSAGKLGEAPGSAGKLETVTSAPRPPSKAPSSAMRQRYSLLAHMRTQSGVEAVADKCAEVPAHHTCIRCGSSALLRCSVCKSSYCSPRCQTDDWHVHKRECIPPPPLEYHDMAPEYSLQSVLCSPLLNCAANYYSAPAVVNCSCGHTAPPLPVLGTSPSRRITGTNSKRDLSTARTHSNTGFTTKTCDESQCNTSHALQPAASFNASAQKKVSQLSCETRENSSSAPATSSLVSKRPAETRQDLLSKPSDGVPQTSQLVSADVKEVVDASEASVTSIASALDVPKPSTHDAVLPLASVLDFLLADHVYSGVVTQLKNSSIFSMIVLLDDMEDAIQEGSTVLESSPMVPGFTPQMGQLVASKTSYDGAWCRSVVYNRDDRCRYFVVCHVDFGFFDKVDVVKPIPTGKFSAAPSTGILARIEPCGGNEAPDVRAEDLLSFRVVSNTEDYTLVDVFDDYDSNVNDTKFRCKLFSLFRGVHLLDLEIPTLNEAIDEAHIDASKQANKTSLNSTTTANTVKLDESRGAPNFPSSGHSASLAPKQLQSSISIGPDHQMPVVSTPPKLPASPTARQSVSPAESLPRLAPSLTAVSEPANNSSFLFSDLRTMAVDVGVKYKVLPVWWEQHFLFTQIFTEALTALSLQQAETMAADCALVSAPDSVRPGELVCAYIADDCMWYRALVLQAPSAASSDAFLYLVDFGNSVRLDLSVIRPFCSRYLDVPITCFKVALGSDPSMKRDQSSSHFSEVLTDVHDILNDLVSEASPLQMLILEHRAGDSGHKGAAAKYTDHPWHVVKLYDSAGLICINDTLVCVSSDGVPSNENDGSTGGVYPAKEICVDETAEGGRTGEPFSPVKVVKLDRNQGSVALEESSEASRTVLSEKPTADVGEVSEKAVKSATAFDVAEGAGKCKDLEPPIPQISKPEPLSTPGKVLMYENCPCIDLEEGEDVELVILCATNTHTIMVLPQKEIQRLEELESLSTSMNEYCNSQRAVYYEPLDGEVVLAKFAQDGLWYRAACLITTPCEGAAVVQFVDYGNIETVLYGAIVRMEERFVKALPFLALHCVLHGCGDEPSDNPACASRVAELLPAFSCVTAQRVLPSAPDTLVYPIVIPHVLRALQSEGLLPASQ